MSKIWMKPKEYIMRKINDEVLIRMKSNRAIVSGYIYFDSESNKYYVSTSPDFEFYDYMDYEALEWCYIPGEKY